MHLWEKRGKSVLGTEVLGNALFERTTNFVWPALQQVRDLFVSVLSSSFLLLPIFFTFYMTYRIGNQLINIERLGNMGFTTISLNSYVKIKLALGIECRDKIVTELKVF